MVRGETLKVIFKSFPVTGQGINPNTRRGLFVCPSCTAKIQVISKQWDHGAPICCESCGRVYVAEKGEVKEIGVVDNA